MTPNTTPLTIIVAATAKNGIGKNGTLPWPMLKQDMAYFARVTKRVPGPQRQQQEQQQEQQHPTPAPTSPPTTTTTTTSTPSTPPANVVIMGRKTWDSIPTSFRPLKDRTNIVISSQSRAQLHPLPAQVIVATDIAAGLESLAALVAADQAPPPGRAFVIGGASIYAAALALPQTTHLLMTRVGREYECDTFFPEGLGDAEEGKAWKRASHAALEEFTGEAVPEGQTAGGGSSADLPSVEFQLYERDTLS